MEDDFKDTSNNLETTLSSELLSVPSGQKLDNISSVTELSDIELEVKNQCLEKETFIPQTSIQDASDRMNDNVDSYNSALPTEVRDTLQANANMLYDKNILKDLLHPGNANYTNNLLNIQKKFTSLAPPERKESSSASKYVMKESDFRLGTQTAPHLSVSSTPKKLPSRKPNEATAPVSSLSQANKEEKHVNFTLQSLQRRDWRKEDIGRDWRKEDTGRDWRNEDIDLYSQFYNSKSVASFLYGPEKVFDKLGEIRDHLEVKFQDFDEDSSSDFPLSRLLAAKLNSQKQRTKDLEEELALNEASLAKITCELEIVQKRLCRREEQLKEAGDQIGRLQGEWQAIQQKLVSSREKYQIENEHMKRVIDSLRKDQESLEKEAKLLRHDSKDCASLRANVEGMKSCVETSSRRSEQVMEENERLNTLLLQEQRKSSQYEKEKFSLEEKLESLHEKLDNLTLSKNSIDEEMRLLRERHAVLLQRAVEETELKEKAISEKEKLEAAAEEMKREQMNFLKGLHQQYQNQLDDILTGKIREITREFEFRQRRFQEESDSQMTSLRNAFEADRRDAQKRHEEETQLIKTKYESKLESLTKELRETRRENELLRSQREAIVAAVTSVVPRTSSEAKTEFIHDENCRPTAPPSEALNKYHISRLKELGAYSAAGKNPLKKVVKSSQQLSRESSSRSRGLAVLGHSGLQPLVASTSLSSLSDGGDSSSSEGRVTVRERKTAQRDRGHEGKKASGSSGGRLFSRKVLTAEQILGATESTFSSSEVEGNSGTLQEVDRQIANLVHELSNIAGSSCNQETPRHDTSLEQDASNIALRRIDLMSDMLANTWKGMQIRKGEI